MSRDVELFFKEMSEKQEQCDKNLQKVLEVKKKKLLKCLGKYDGEVNTDDEHLETRSFDLTCLFKPRRNPTLFDDSVVDDQFNSLKREPFELSKYVFCVKWLLREYLGLPQLSPLTNLNSAISYILSHARNFDEPLNDMFTFSQEDTEIAKVIYEYTDEDIPSHHPFIRKLNTIMKDLKENFDETKFQQLNFNITYLILLMAIRIGKNENSLEMALRSDKVAKDYVALCPMNLGNQLPQICRKTNELLRCLRSNIRVSKIAVLILHSLLHGGPKTKRILKATCTNHLQYNGLGLVKQFEEVSRIYDVHRDVLFDLMSRNIKVAHSLIHLADLYYFQYEAREIKGFKLFSYCRIVNNHYHCNLSNGITDNQLACYALAMLIDLKLGCDKSFATNAQWTTELNVVHKNAGIALAREIRSSLQSI